MVRVVVALVGTYFAAFAATSLVVGSDAVHQPARPATLKADPLGSLDGAGRGDLRSMVREVELIGGGAVSVILRDGEGRIVLMIDEAAGTTIAAKGVSLPSLRLHAEPGAVAPPGPPASEEQAIEDEESEEQVFACESGLSVLADRKAASLPRVCLAEADVSIRREGS